jgi:chromosome segregation ATPase
MTAPSPLPAPVGGASRLRFWQRFGATKRLKETVAEYATHLAHRDRAIQALVQRLEVLEENLQLARREAGRLAHEVDELAAARAHVERDAERVAAALREQRTVLLEIEATLEVLAPSRRRADATR